MRRKEVKKSKSNFENEILHCSVNHENTFQIQYAKQSRTFSFPWLKMLFMSLHFPHMQYALIQLNFRSCQAIPCRCLYLAHVFMAQAGNYFWFEKSALVMKTSQEISSSLGIYCLFRIAREAFIYKSDAIYTIFTKCTPFDPNGGFRNVQHFNLLV